MIIKVLFSKLLLTEMFQMKLTKIKNLLPDTMNVKVEKLYKKIISAIFLLAYIILWSS